MIHTVFIDSMEGVKDLIFEQEYDSQSKRMRSSYCYRGMPDASYNILTSLQRNCKDKYKELEMPMLESFIKYACFEEPSIQDSIWEAMIVGQHHGLPTRLLDWTHSVLTALHFANSEVNLDKLGKRDCVIWRIDCEELNRKLPQKYRAVLSQKKTLFFNIDTLSSVVDGVESYDRDMGSDSLVCLEPPSIDQRIVGQFAFFTIIPKGINNLEDFLEEHSDNTYKYVISKDLRWNLRDLLDEFNINERLIYPGVDGIAKWVSRHYYVMTENGAGEE